MRHKLTAEANCYKEDSSPNAEFIIGGNLWIDEQEYSFERYEDVDSLKSIRLKTGKMSATICNEYAAIAFESGEDTVPGQLLKRNIKSSVKKVNEAALIYKTANLQVWIARFNYMARNIAPYDFSLTSCVAMPGDRFVCTITTPSPECSIIHYFGFEEGKPKVQSPLSEIGCPLTFHGFSKLKRK